jgi:hypothetical protein
LSQLSQVPFEQKPSLQGSELWKPVALCTVKNGGELGMAKEAENKTNRVGR